MGGAGVGVRKEKGGAGVRVRKRWEEQGWKEGGKEEKGEKRGIWSWT